MTLSISPLVVYCEGGAYVGIVKDLRRERLIKVIIGPYDTQPKKKRFEPARPSLVTMDSTYFTCDNPTPISDLVESPKYEEILRIIGKQNRQDALHLDSAYKSHAQAFLTSDWQDVGRNRDELQKALGFPIFHMPKEAMAFESWVRCDRPSVG